MIRQSVLILAVALGATLSAAFPASAQDMDTTHDAYGTPAFEALLQGELMQRLRREAVQRSMALHMPDCFEEPELEVLETYPVAPVTLVDGAVVPTSGLWRERVFNRVCGETSTENMVHTFTADGQQTFLLVRGRTRADLETQLSVVGIAVETAMRDDAAEGCDVGRISDTYVTEEYNSERWQERWEVRACSARIDLDITFNSAGADGTTYELSVAD